MDISTAFESPLTVKTNWLLLPIWKNGDLSPAISAVDEKLGGVITRLREREDFTGKANQLTPLHQCDGIVAERVLLVGLGKAEEADLRGLFLAAATAAKSVTGSAHDKISLLLPEVPAALSAADMTRSFVTGLAYGSEGPGLHKSKTEKFPPKTIEILGADNADKDFVTTAGNFAGALARGVSLTRELVNMPPCDLYPETFAKRAEEVAKKVNIECLVMDEKRIVEEKMGSLMGVAQGSDKPPRVVVLKYTGKPGGKTLGLVGKGVTFDSGGLSLKPSDGMLDMKCDMAGAGTVLGAVQAIAELKLPVNVVAVLALVENMPSGKALKLGDVLHARNGKTIEIHNTDAEGRLILADALAYAVDQKVDNLVDLATLTGAYMVALGMEVNGLMTNDDTWRHKVEAAAKQAGELVWALPMFPLYNELISSHVADIKNTGGSRWGGAITAAKLLEEFVGDVPWVHLDIAGPAWKDSPSASSEAGGTGTMVKTLVELARTYE